MRVIARERNRRRGTIADREAGGGDPQRGPKGHFPADEDVQRTPAHRRGRPAAARCPESMDYMYHRAMGFGGGGKCGAAQSMARGHALTCAIKGRQP